MRRKELGRKRSFSLIWYVMLILILTMLSGVCVSASDTHRNDFSDFDGMTIGVMTGSVQEKYVQEQIPGAEIAYFNSPADLIVALEQQKIDATAQPLLTINLMMKDNKKLICDERILGSDKVCFAFSKTETGKKLQKEFNEYLENLIHHGELEQYTKLYYDDTEEEKYHFYDFDSLEGPNGTINYGTCTQKPPFCFMTGNGMTGVDAEILYGFCQEYGYRIHMEDTVLVSILAGISTGLYDMGGGGIAYTEERAQNAYFSDAYFESLQVLVELKGSGVGTSGLADDVMESNGLISALKNSFEGTFIKENRWKLLLVGLGNTLLVTVGAFFFGTLLGCLVTVLMLINHKGLHKIIQMYHYLMQGMPILVILMLLYYVVFASTRIAPILVAIIGFGLSSGSGISEGFYGAIKAVPRGEQEASLALGFSPKQTFVNIILPQAIQKALPGYRSQLVSLLKGTSVVGYIAIQDITKMADVIRSRSFDAFLPLLTTAIVYFVLVFLIRYFFERILKHLDHTGKTRNVRGVQA